MARAYSYVRFSSPEQGKGDSLRRQVEATRHFAEQHGLELDESLRDIGVSAFKGANRHKGALSEFLRLAKQGRVPQGSFLIIESLDRLSREQVLDALKIFIAIIDAGITIVTLADGQMYEQRSVQGDFTKLIISLSIMSRAHEESRIKAERLGAAWENKRRNAATKKLTARCPSWLRLAADRQSFELIQDRVALVQRILQLAASGIGRHATVRILNREQVPSFRGGAWNASSVHKVLTSDAVMGIYQPHSKRSGMRVPISEPIMGYYPAVADAALVATARAAMASRRIGHSGRKGSNFTNLFSGIVRCAECKGTMTYRDKGERPKGGQYLGGCPVEC